MNFETIKRLKRQKTTQFISIAQRIDGIGDSQPEFCTQKNPTDFFFFFKVSSPSSDFWVQNYSQTHHETYERIHQK